MEISQIVTLSLNLFLLFFILIGFLWGVKRGLKKSAYRILFIAIGLLLAFFLSAPITTALINMDISSFVQLEVDGATYKTINEYIEALLLSNPDIADLMANSEALKELILQLPVIISQTIIFVILFWLFKAITWPIWALVTKNAYVQKHENTQPPKKKRLFGGLVGIAQGILIVFVTILPISGTIGLVKELDKETTNNIATSSQANNETLLEYILNEISTNPKETQQYLDILKSYDKSFLGTVNNSTGLDLALFDSLTASNVNGKSIVPRKEIGMVNEVYQSYQQLLYLDIKDIDGSYDFNKIEKLINTVFGSGILGAVADDIMPYFANKILETQTDMDPIIKTFLTSYLDTYGTPAFDTLKNDCLVLVETAKAIQSNDLLQLAHGDEFTPEQVLGMLQRTTTDNPISDIMTALLQSSTLKNLLSESVNLALSYLDRSLTTFAGHEVTTQKVEINNVNWETEKNNIINLLNNLVDIGYKVAPYIDSKTVDYNNVIQNIEFAYIGKTIDIFANSQLFADAYQNICDTLNNIDKTSKYFNFSSLQNNIVYENEFAHLDRIKNTLNQAGVLNTLITNPSTNNIVNALQLLDTKPESSNEKYITTIANELMASNLIKSSMPRIIDVLNNTIEKELSVEINDIDESNINWETEEEYFKNILQDIASNHAFISVILNTNSTTTDIMNALDIPKLKSIVINAKESNLFKNSFNGAINYLKNNQEINKIIDFSKVDENFDWNNELDTLNEVINILKDNNVWNDFINNPEDVNNIVSNLENEVQVEIFSKLSQSAFFSDKLIEVVNAILETAGDYLGTTLTPIDNTIDLTNQTDNIIDISNDLLDISESGASLDEVDLDLIASLLENLKINKFTLQGVFSELYNEFVNWIINPSNNEYASVTEKTIRTFDTANPATANTCDIPNVDWQAIFDAVQYLDTKKTEFDSLSTISTTDLKALMNDISQNAVENQTIIDIIKIYLTNNESNQDKINAVNNFDFMDYNTFATIIDALDLFSNAMNNINDDKLSALTDIKTALDSLKVITSTKINNTVNFLDSYANTNVSDKMNGVNFVTESNVVSTMIELLNAQTYNLDTLKTFLSQLSNSTLILNEMDNNNIILFDTTDTSVIDSLRDAIAEENNIPDSSLVTDEYVVLGVKSLINEIDTSNATKIKIAKLFNISLV